MSHMNVKKIATNYFEQALDSVEGLKVLLVDSEMKHIISILYTQTRLLQHQVVLVEHITNVTRVPMKFLKCIAFLRPSSHSLTELSSELQGRNYMEYHLFFTHFLDLDQLQGIANADVGNLVKRVEEVYLDFSPVTDETFIVPMPPRVDGPSCPVNYAKWDNTMFNRLTQGVISVMLGLKKRPFIRHRSGSKMAERLAKDVSQKMRVESSMFGDLSSRDVELLILDRVDDPVTPLLTQWTYTAMIHELIGIENNKITLDDMSLGPNERVQILAPEHDPFYAQHMYSNWGDLCVAVKALVDTYKTLNKIDMDTASIDDIKAFVSRIGDARGQSTSVTKHTTILGQIGDEVRQRNLCALSEIEQDVAVNNNLSEHSHQVRQAVEDPSSDVEDALRLAILYELRYEGKDASTSNDLRAILQRRGCTQSKLELIDKIKDYAGQRKRLGSLFKPKENILKTMVNVMGAFSDGASVANVFTQHKPWMKKLITQLYNGQLPLEEYPYMGAAPAQMTRPKEIIVFMIGGATFEEAHFIHELSAGRVENSKPTAAKKAATAASPSTKRPAGEFEEGGMIEAKVVLGSTSMLNARTFMSQFLEPVGFGGM